MVLPCSVTFTGSPLPARNIYFLSLESDDPRPCQLCSRHALVRFAYNGEQLTCPQIRPVLFHPTPSHQVPSAGSLLFPSLRVQILPPVGPRWATPALHRGRPWPSSPPASFLTDDTSLMAFVPCFLFRYLCLGLRLLALWTAWVSKRSLRCAHLLVKNGCT